MGLAGVGKRAWHIREWYGKRYVVTHPVRSARFLLGSRETTNFTYDISNDGELAAFLSDAFGRPAAEFQGYIDELRDDKELEGWLTAPLSKRPGRDAPARYGRRLGWYALARAVRPKVVIETGTHDGLGTSVFARAVERNARDGHAGRVWTFDHEAGTGWLVPAPLRPLVDFVAGDIEDSLPAKLKTIRRGDLGLFLHDSRHSYEHERFEFDRAVPFLSKSGVLITDNSHDAKALQDVARENGGHFAYWKERPRHHPYPGSGIGLATFAKPKSKHKAPTP